MQAKTLGVSIDRPWQEVYDAVWRPEMFPKWASGLSTSSLTKDGERWHAEGPEGTVHIRFTDRNAFGVMDHHVDIGRGPEVYVPLRIIANGEGAEVLLTLFRQPEMSDETFQTDIEWVERDLLALRALVAG